MNYFSYLTDGEIRYAHDASLEILEEAGLLVRNEKARKRFAEHGAQVDHATEMVRLPAVVDARIRAVFDGLVAGESTVPEGWRRVAAGGNGTMRERRKNRRRRLAS